MKRRTRGGHGRRLGRRRAFLAAVGVACALIMTSCSSQQIERFDSSGWSSSLPALGTVVLDAYVVGDTAALARLRLTRTQHDDQIWPELPVASSGTSYTAAMAWENISRRNRRAVSRNLNWFEGRDADFLDLRCRGETQLFETFSVHTDCWVQFRVEEGVAEAQLFKDVVERAGGYKIFRYYDEGVRMLEPAVVSARPGS